jgi:hypothetical protein
LWAIQPTCRELTNLKKAVSQRVNKRAIGTKMLEQVGGRGKPGRAGQDRTPRENSLDGADRTGKKEARSNRTSQHGQYIWDKTIVAEQP